MSLNPTIRSIAAVSLLACLGACNKSGPRYDSATAAYDAKDYNASLQMASKDADRSHGSKQDQAALIAGMSAHALKNTSEARRWLEPLTKSEDPVIAGRAAAELGLIEAEQGHHEQAVKDFDTASLKLSGNEQAHADFMAGESYTALGRTDMARLSYRRAMSTATDAGLKSQIESRLSLGGYTLQVGAFADRTNAERAASKVVPTASKLGLEQPKVVARPGSNGRTLYAVQVGSFKDKTEADKARSRFGDTAVVTRVTTN